MTEEEQDLWSILDNVNAWIRFADAKAGATLAVSAAIIGLTTADITNSSESPGILALAVLSILAGLGVLATTVLALAPILEGSEERDTTVFFGHIAAFDSTDAYLTAVRDTRDRGLLATEVSHQIRENARIATYKFKKVRTSFQFVFVQLAASALMLIVEVVTGA